MKHITYLLLTLIISLTISCEDYYGEKPEEIIPTEVILWGTVYSVESTDSLNISSLEENELTGTIPSTIGYLTNLRYLNLEDNELTGVIPASIGNLTNLTYLNLMDNKLN